MRIRLTFSKFGPMQYVGHLDLHRSWERTFRRSCLPLAYSSGFHPQPRLNLACALPLGFTSQCEILDAWLEVEVPIEDMRDSLTASLPPGLEIHAITLIDPKVPALQTQVVSAVYQICFLDKLPDLEGRLERILSAAQLPRSRRDKPYDLRPLIEEATLLPSTKGEYDQIRLQLSAREAATGRPEEFLDEIGVKIEDTQIHRQQLIFKTSQINQ